MYFLPVTWKKSIMHLCFSKNRTCHQVIASIQWSNVYFQAWVESHFWGEFIRTFSASNWLTSYIFRVCFFLSFLEGMELEHFEVSNVKAFLIDDLLCESSICVYFLSQQDYRLSPMIVSKEKAMESLDLPYTCCSISF